MYEALERPLPVSRDDAANSTSAWVGSLTSWVRSCDLMPWKVCTIGTMLAQGMSSRTATMWPHRFCPSSTKAPELPFATQPKLALVSVLLMADWKLTQNLPQDYMLYIKQTSTNFHRCGWRVKVPLLRADTLDVHHNWPMGTFRGDVMKGHTVAPTTEIIVWKVVWT